jgi:predicted AlkP superfamily phosphohydrolase/phosphomutase
MGVKTRLIVIGLDCASPDLLFHRYAGGLPNLNRLRESGWWGEVESCVPPITVPAWMVMFSGKEPGELGMYGFRNRVPGTYNETRVADSGSVRATAIWDRAAAAGRRSILMGVPPSYPPFEVNGELISCFLTPGTDRPYTYPRGLAVELEEQELTYVPDVLFRKENKAEVLEDLRGMTEGHFDIACYLAEEHPWDLFIMVEIGLDRVQHAFWRYQDPSHHLYEPGSPFSSALEDYYKLLDRRIGDLLKACGPDAAVAVVSDHGAKGMKGAFCINQWLAERGYLTLRGEVGQGTRLEDAPVDWRRTKAWGWGGYYARIFLNVEGREPEGIIAQEHFQAELEALAEDIGNIRGPEGEEWATSMAIPRDIYSRTEGDVPDLMVFFDDLCWRAAGTLGYPCTYLEENDTGPDDAVHDWRGTGILYHPHVDMNKEINRDYLRIQELYGVFAGLLGMEDGDRHPWR